jgi:aminoglycoside phosphotransferase (APT) family kinase protein
MTNNSKQEWIEQRHAQWSASEELLEKAVASASGSRIASRTRLIQGIMNEVYDVRTESGEDLIVRIARWEYPHFVSERWALERMGELHLPVPRVRHLDHVSEEDRIASILVLDKLPGESLRPILESGDLARKRTLVFRLGQFLAKVHSIETNGFGSLDGQGKGSAGNEAKWLRAGIEVDADDCGIDEPSWMYEGALKGGIDGRWVDGALEILSGHPHPSEGITARLVHNDFKSNNILVSGSQVTAILDFEFCGGWNPIRDIAYWHYWHGPTHAEWLIEGYQLEAELPEDLDETIRLFRITTSLAYLGWLLNDSLSWPGAADWIQTNLIEDVEWFQSRSLR